MWSAIFITILCLLVLACIVVLFMIQPEDAPRARHTDKPREGGTELMPKIMNPRVPPTKKKNN